MWTAAAIKNHLNQPVVLDLFSDTGVVVGVVGCFLHTVFSFVLLCFKEAQPAGEREQVRGASERFERFSL